MDYTSAALWPYGYGTGYMPTGAPWGGPSALQAGFSWGGPSAFPTSVPWTGIALPAAIPEARPWAPEAPPTQFLQLLRMIEASYVLDEVRHSFHVELLKQHPEVAADPAQQDFARHSQAALHAKVAAAGLLRRALSGEFTREVTSLVTDQLRAYARAFQQANRHLRELAQKPIAAQIPEVRVIQNVLGYEVQAHNLLGYQSQVALGITLDAPAVEAAEN